MIQLEKNVGSLRCYTMYGIEAVAIGKITISSPQSGDEVNMLGFSLQNVRVHKILDHISTGRHRNDLPELSRKPNCNGGCVMVS